MKFYTIYPSENVNPDFSFDVKSRQEKIIDFFKFDEDTGFSKYPVINLTFDDDLKTEINLILKTDFYFSSSGILLFSQDFLDKVKNEIEKECNFYRCEINGQVSNIYAMHIINKKKLLETNNTINKNINQDDFFICKDISMPYFYLITEKFVNMVKEKKLKMNFLEYSEK
jgi:hypothetical protein